jgi:protein-disulfide isomerase
VCWRGDARVDATEANPTGGTMIARSRAPVLSILTAAALIGSAGAAELQRSDVEAIVREYLAAHPEMVEGIVRDYIAGNPDVIGNALADFVKRRSATTPNQTSSRTADPASAPKSPVEKNARLLFDSSHQVVLGNPQGDTTLVEFFDYNCGYCKRALADTLALLRDDPRLRIVLKEYPILGPRSVEAARVSVAARMQDPGGRRFFDFHSRLLGTNGPIDKTVAMAAARDAGFDLARIEFDLPGEEVRNTLAESTQLARELGIRGTPGYVVGTTVIPGAIGAAGLKERIASSRTAPRQ